MFQSAPLTEARGDTCEAGAQVLQYIVSIRSPHRSKGRRNERTVSLLWCQVSIRSPHRSKGRPCIRGSFDFQSTFQSAPLTEARGDQCTVVRSTNPHRFQSAPLTEARGDLRAPVVAMPSSLFQSAPLTEARGDPRSATRSPVLSSFNPLPSPKQGETDRASADQNGSNVSIRSPHRSKGRHVSRDSGSAGDVFQSAPLTEARGDLSVQAGIFIV